MLKFKFSIFGLVCLICIMTNAVMAESKPSFPTLSPTLEIDIPSLSYTTPKVSYDFYAKLDYSHSEDNKYYWVLSAIEQTSDAVVKGKKLYDRTCVMCHGIGGKSSISSSDPKRIRAAIITDTGGMGQLSLTDTDLENVAEYIKKLIGSDPLTEVEIGQNLYDNKCLACHALGTPSSISSIEPNNILAAILTNTGGMGKLSTMSEDDLKAISDYLKQLP